jgi:hypothetical protein
MIFEMKTFLGDLTVQQRKRRSDEGGVKMALS